MFNASHNKRSESGWLVASVWLLTSISRALALPFLLLLPFSLTSLVSWGQNGIYGSTCGVSDVWVGGRRRAESLQLPLLSSRNLKLSFTGYLFGHTYLHRRVRKRWSFPILIVERGTRERGPNIQPPVLPITPEGLPKLLFRVVPTR